MRVDSLIGQFIEIQPSSPGAAGAVFAIDGYADALKVETCAVEFEEFEEDDAEVFFCEDMSCGDFWMALKKTYYETDLSRSSVQRD